MSTLGIGVGVGVGLGCASFSFYKEFFVNDCNVKKN